MGPMRDEASATSALPTLRSRSKRRPSRAPGHPLRCRDSRSRLAGSPPGGRPVRRASRMRDIVERMESLLDRAGGPGCLRQRPRGCRYRAIRVAAIDANSPLWIIGDLHGDLLALEAALSRSERTPKRTPGTLPRIVFLGDFFDDEGFGLEVLLRVFERIVEAPGHVCVIAGTMTRRCRTTAFVSHRPCPRRTSPIFSTPTEP